MGVVALLASRWKLLLLLPVATSLLFWAGSFLLENRYVARASFVPETGSGLPLGAGVGLGVLAAQLGAGGLLGNTAESPDFYLALLDSREVLDRALESRFAVPEDAELPADSASLLDILEATELSDEEDATLPERMENARRHLQAMVDSNLDRTSGVVTLGVESSDRELSAAVANRLIELLNEFNLTNRSRKAGERRRFIEARLRDTRRDFAAAQANYQRWLEDNRVYESSPRLMFESQRLQREVQRLEEVYLQMAREFESARINEVDDIPTITVIDSAVPPWTRAKPQRAVILLLSLLVSFALTVIGIVSWGALGVEVGSPLGRRAPAGRGADRDLAGVR